MISDPERVPGLSEALDIDAHLLMSHAVYSADSGRAGLGLEGSVDLLRLRVDDPLWPELSPKQLRWHLQARLGVRWLQSPLVTEHRGTPAGASPPASADFSFDLLAARFLSDSNPGAGPAVRARLGLQPGPGDTLLGSMGGYLGAALHARSYDAARRRRASLDLFAGVGGEVYLMPCSGPGCPTGGDTTDDDGWSSDDDDSDYGDSGDSGDSDDVALWAFAPHEPEEPSHGSVEPTLGGLAACVALQGHLPLGRRLELNAGADFSGFPEGRVPLRARAWVGVDLAVLSNVYVSLGGWWDHLGSAPSVRTEVDGYPLRMGLQREVLQARVGLRLSAW